MNETEFNSLILNAKRIQIKVKTQMPKTKLDFAKSTSECLIIELNAAPENNKANIELIKFFKKEFKKNVRIVMGFTAREKVVEIID